MNTGLENSVVLITSTKKDNVIGTGFAIHRDQDQTYLVTCAHVIKDVGGEDSVLVNGIPAKVLALGDVQGFDLAILQAEGLSNLPLLHLITLSGEEKRTIKIAGYYLYSGNKQHSCKTIEGICSETGEVVQLIEKSLERAAVLELRMSQENQLQAGYSGSPVIDQETSRVLGVVTHMEKEGKIGRAISIAALLKIREMPSLSFPLEVSMASTGDGSQSSSNLNARIKTVETHIFSGTKVLEEIKKLPSWVKAIFAFIIMVSGVSGWDYIQANPNESVQVNQDSPDLEYQRIGVTVRNRENAQPVENVTVQIIFDGPPVQKMTDRNGYFEIEVPARETAQVTLTKAGFKTATETVGLKVDPDKTKLIYLDPEN
ncbi:S1 family peptidase [Limnoraphis robusta]|uniref:Uncharacterized protein n=1 Tax=Limnoraphis robusta CS-951 TaxID=1637645 RepID=A0A0F5YKK6_9CYAN|nr:trypsin-like peptidase domain-containing protein [Limnoraphis robusta]KKD39293.1 hypothetical protein WN50_04210 [Limnoraphis robusta CS-951]